MRTTVNLDDQLLKQAGELSGVKERTELLREADEQFARAADIGNDDIPTDQRLIAWQDLVLRMQASAAGAPAPSMPSSSTTQPFMMIAPRPMKPRFLIVQPCTIAIWPISTSSPMMVGHSGAPGFGPSQWTTLPSWMLVRAPITIRLTSARSTQLYQMLASGPMVTSPVCFQESLHLPLGLG